MMKPLGGNVVLVCSVARLSPETRIQSEAARHVFRRSLFAFRAFRAFARHATMFFFSLAALCVSPALYASDHVLPEAVQAQAQIIRAEREGYWEKSLVVTFPERRRALTTFDGFVNARAALNHSADPRLWVKVSKEFQSKSGRGGKAYVDHIHQKLAGLLKLNKSEIARMATAADMDNLAVTTRAYGPLTVTVLATAGAKTNAIRTGVDEGRSIEGLSSEAKPHGTINIMVLTNAQLSDGAMARAIVTVTEGKTAALEDLKVPSTYTPEVQATGTGTDSVIVVSGTTGPRTTYTGGHSRIGELIGKATYAAVVEALGKQNGYFLSGEKRFTGESVGAPKAPGTKRLALLHLDAVPGDVSGNRARIEAAIKDAVAHGADWIVTPELAETGYDFAKRIDTDWIEPFPGTWISTLSAIARDNHVALFVGFAEREEASGELHNSAAVIDRDGAIRGVYRKRRVHGSAEAWAVPGKESPRFVVDGVPVGVLICADAYKPDIAAQYREQNVSLLLSLANWPPNDQTGPKNYWAERSRETGIPLVSVNRTGKEPELDFSQGQSVVYVDGKRLFAFSSPETHLFYVDWDGKSGFSPVAD